MSVFRSAITDSDGSVDAGYLSLFWTMVVILNAIPCVLAMVAVKLWIDPAHPLDLSGIGLAIGGICTGFGAVCGAIGLFRAGDKPRPNTVTTATSSMETAVTQPDTEPKKGKR
jgi:hypothetical protein